MNKREERFFVEGAASALGANWNIGDDRETPDFVIVEDGHQFGLEVSELFNGPEEDAGAELKAAESKNQTIIDGYRKLYEEERDVAIRVQVLGEINSDIMDELLRALLGHDFVSKDMGEQMQFQLRDDFKVYATKALRAEWIRIDDRGGWVNQDPLPIIMARVASKARKLQNYQDAVGLDVRLLLVANRLYNSGRMRLLERDIDDTHGFHTIYFYSYPEDVTVLVSEQ